MAKFGGYKKQNFAECLKFSNLQSLVVLRTGAKILLTGGDYCVFICGHQVIEHQFVMPFVEVVKTIPGKCVSRWKRVLKMWSNCGQILGIQETRLCKVIKNQQFTKSCRASGGNRTRTTLSGQGILSPSCLPFHHQGKAIAPQPLIQPAGTQIGHKFTN